MSKTQSSGTANLSREATKCGECRQPLEEWEAVICEGCGIMEKEWVCIVFRGATLSHQKVFDTRSGAEKYAAKWSVKVGTSISYDVVIKAIN